MKRAVALLAVLALVLAACSGSDDAEVATLDDGSTSTTIVDDDAGAVSASEEEALLAFAACMRENGIEDFEDPIINADGSIEFGGQAVEGEGIPDEAELEKLDAAFSACSSSLEGVSFGAGESFDITEFEDAFVEFSACMRDKGFDIDDPDFSAMEGPGGFINMFGDLDITDPATMEALDECQEAFAGFGPGGG